MAPRAKAPTKRPHWKPHERKQSSFSEERWMAGDEGDWEGGCNSWLLIRLQHKIGHECVHMYNTETPIHAGL